MAGNISMGARREVVSAVAERYRSVDVPPIHEHREGRQYEKESDHLRQEEREFHRNLLYSTFVGSMPTDRTEERLALYVTGQLLCASG